LKNILKEIDYQNFEKALEKKDLKFYFDFFTFYKNIDKIDVFI